MDFVLRHQELGLAKDLAAPPRVGVHDVDLIELGNCTFKPVGEGYMFVKDVLIVLFILYYELCSWKICFLSTLVSLEGVRYIFVLSFKKVRRVFHTHSFYRM